MSTNTKGIYYSTSADAPITEEARSLATANSVPVGPNYIINGDMEINQRGITSVALTSGGHYTSDRFFGQSFGTIGVNQIRSSVVPDNNVFTTSTLFDCTSIASGTGYAINYTHRLEGFNAKKLGLTSGRPATLSFWVRSTRTGSYGITLSSGFRGTTYNFSYYVATYTINQENTWEYKTITITENSSTYTEWYTDNRNGLEITFNITGGTGIATATTTNAWVELSTNAYFYGATTTQKDWGSSTADEFYITGIQLEEGSAATTFRRNAYSIQGELAACRRYYRQELAYIFAVLDAAYNNSFTGVQYDVIMRAAPTVTVTGGSLDGHHGIAPQVYGGNERTATFRWPSGSGQRDGGAGNVSYTASAEL
jgi:hypothetical protein